MSTSVDAAARQKAGLRPPWQPGQSANAHGVQKGFRQVLAAARKHSLEAFNTVVAVMRDENTPPQTKLACAVTILERAWGKPKEHLQLDGDGIATLQIRFVDERRDGPVIDAEAFQLTLGNGDAGKSDAS